MPLIVQKYGGSSLASHECIRHVARRVATAAQTASVVVVVSAMKGETDALIRQAHDMSLTPVPQAYDALLALGEQRSAALLAMALPGSRLRQPLSLMNAGLRRIGANGRLIGSVFCGGFFIVIWIYVTALRPWAAETGRADFRYLFSVARRIATLGFVHLAAVRAKVRCNHDRHR